MAINTLEFRPDLGSLRPYKCNDVGGILPWRLYKQDTTDPKLCVLAQGGDHVLGLSLKKEKASNDAGGLGTQADLCTAGNPLWVETAVAVNPGQPLTVAADGKVKVRTTFDDDSEPLVGIARSKTTGTGTEILAFDPSFQ